MKKKLLSIAILLTLACSFAESCPLQSGGAPLSEQGQNVIEYLRSAQNNLIAGKYLDALNDYAMAIDTDPNVDNYHFYNAACAAAMSGETDKAFHYLNMRVEADHDWYSDNINADKNLLSLHDDQRWRVLNDTLELRKLRIERDYDKELREELKSIFNSDQNIRQEYLAARNNPEEGQAIVVDSLSGVMMMVDSLNQRRIIELIEERGWPGREVVGDASQVYFLILQHSPLNVQSKYLPLVQRVAQRGDISLSNLAMFEDRIAISEGRKQIYGTQIIYIDGIPQLAPLDEPETVDDRRKSVGLGPIGEYLNRWQINWQY